MPQFEYYGQGALLEAYVVEGVLHVNPKCPSDAFVKVGQAYFLPQAGLDEQPTKEDVFVKGTNRNRTLHGDRVLVELLTDVPVADRSPGGQPCGRVVGLVKRTTRPIYCVLRCRQHNPASTVEDELRIAPQEQSLRAVPLDRRYPWFLVSKQDYLRHAPDKNAAALPEYSVFTVEFTTWKVEHKFPVGRIIRYEGECLAPMYETKAVLATHEIADWEDPIGPEIVDWTQRRVDYIISSWTSIVQGCYPSHQLFNGPYPQVRRKVDANPATVETKFCTSYAECLPRYDVRELNVISIDPETARDLDDAIHVRELPDCYEIGVHIADVSFVIPKDSPVDLEAAKRSTTVYLPNQAYHMLPRSVCQQLCSLDQSGDKLAFSVFIYFDKTTFTQLPDRQCLFAKTLVSNKARLNYDQVQDYLNRYVPEHVTPPNVDEGGWDISIGQTKISELVKCTNISRMFDEASELLKQTKGSVYTLDQLQRDLRVLHEITKELRRARFEAGSVNLSSLQLRFHCDKDGVPTEVVEEEHSASHWMIEELMLLANKVVSKRVQESPGGSAALARFHPRIDPKKADKVRKVIHSIIPDLMVSPDAFATTKGLRDLLRLIANRTTPRLAMYIEHCIILNLEQARYCWYDRQSTFHFALGFDLYTHFTSPIRRYADLLVHRQLSLVLYTDALHGKATDENRWVLQELVLALMTKEVGYSSATDSMEGLEDDDILEHINEVRINAKRAGDMAASQWLLMYLAGRDEPVFTASTVVQISNQSLMLHVPDFHTDVRVEYSVQVDSIRTQRKIRAEHLGPVEVPQSYRYTEAAQSCHIQWADGSHVDVKMFDALTVWVLPSKEVPMSLVAVPVRPDLVSNAVRRGKRGLRAAVIKTVDVDAAGADI